MHKTYLITGAGTGIGSATAIKLASQDHKLVLIGRRKPLLDELNSKLKNADLHIVLSVDVADKQALNQSLESIEIEKLNLCGVFANAGIGGPNEYGPDDRWEEMIGINLSGVYYTIMECLPALRKSKDEYKHIVITSSCLARFGVPFHAAYCTTKTGLLGLTRSLAVQYGSEKILVNALTPGWVDTKMARDGIQNLANDQDKKYEEVLDEQMKVLPLNKMAQPEEVANLVSFLFSNQQTSITGQAMDINNGAYMS